MQMHLTVARGVAGFLPTISAGIVISTGSKTWMPMQRACHSPTGGVGGKNKKTSFNDQAGRIG